MGSTFSAAVLSSFLVVSGAGLSGDYDSAAPEKPCWQIKVGVDVTGSPELAPLNTALDTLYRDLRRLAEDFEVCRIGLFDISEKSHRSEVFSIELPRYVPSSLRQERSELMVLQRVREEVQAQAAAAREERRQAHRRRIRRALKALTPKAVTLGGETPCTDLQGALRRVAFYGPPTLGVLVTDGLESCSGGLRPVPEPPRGNALAVIVVPAGTGRGDTAHESILGALRLAVPWAVVLPSYADFYRVLSEVVRNQTGRGAP